MAISSHALYQRPTGDEMKAKSNGVIQIDHNIPYPSHAATKYPYRRMKVGDSFRAPLSKRATLEVLSAQYGKSMQRKFSMRSAPNYVRVWRIK
jgi:hypothetical protein